MPSATVRRLALPPSSVRRVAPRWAGPTVMIGLALVLIGVFGGAYWDGYQLRREAARLAREGDELRRENAQLREELQLLTTPEYIERLARENLRVNLAISLHAATDEVRSRLMPANRAFRLDELLAACRRFPLPVRQRMTFEYVLLDGINDRPEDARALARRLRGIRAKVNLIPFNAWAGSGFRRPPAERIAAFQRALLDAGITATVRWSKGEDVGGACGQLETADRRPEMKVETLSA